MERHYLKKILIISPYFPPSNAADMQRIRMSLPYYERFGWIPEVVVVNEVYSEMVKDKLLLETIPPHIRIHKVNALSKKFTGKIGLGNLALRSMYFYKNYIDNLLKKNHFDLIYFSTTQFPIMILGKHWKRKYKIPYVIDMQDPWHSNYYEDKPKSERPPKYWFSYRLNKFLEPIAMSSVDGLISVSQAYLDTLNNRYSRLKNCPQKVITFGATPIDFKIVEKHKTSLNLAYIKEVNTINIVYIGRGGYDLHKGLGILFKAISQGIKLKPEVYKRIKFHFLGTSYAPQGTGTPTVSILAEKHGLSMYVEEKTDRMPYFESLYNLEQADGLLIIGSDDIQYTASKLYPYILAKKPLLAIFHSQSSAFDILKKSTNSTLIPLNKENEDQFEKINIFFESLINNNSSYPIINEEYFKDYLALSRCQLECQLFEEVISNQLN